MATGTAKSTTKSAQRTAQRGPVGAVPSRGGVAGGPYSGALALQRLAGNSAVDGLLRPPQLPEPGIPAGLPPSVRQTLAGGGGYPLDSDTRQHMEARFDADFSGVRVHTDGQAADSARSVNASAYTVGRHIIFDAQRYSPQGIEGKRLLAHELAHVVQQSRGGAPPPPLPGGPLEADAEEASSAFVGGGPVRVQRASRSGIARQARPRSLSQNFNPRALSDEELEQEVMLLQGWLQAHATTNTPESEQAVNSLHKLEAEAARRTNAKKAPQPPPAKNPLLPTVTGNDKEDLLNAMRAVQSIKPSDVASGLFTGTFGGKEISLNQKQYDELVAKAKSAIQASLRRARSDGAGALTGYNSQNETDKKHWFIAPIIKTIGRVKDPGPYLIAEAAKAQTSADAAIIALNKNNFTEAARLLADSEAAGQKAQKLWQAYFQGIIGAGEMTVTVLEYTRNAAFITLGVLAIIATGGAAAGATTAFGLEIGSAATAANVIATGAPIVATLSEAGLKAALGDKVDWGKVAVDVAVNLILARFGGKMSEGIFKVIAGNPAVQSLGRVAVSRIISSILSHELSTVFTQSVDAVYRLLKGQNVTWDQFTDELLKRLTDPKGIAIATVMGAVQTGAQVKYGAQATGGGEVKKDAQPQPRPTEQTTPAQQTPQQPATTAPARAQAQNRTETPTQPTTPATTQPATPTGARRAQDAPDQTPQPTTAAKPTQKPTPSTTAKPQQEPTTTATPGATKPAQETTPPAQPAQAENVPIGQRKPITYDEAFGQPIKEVQAIPDKGGPVTGQKLGAREPGETVQPAAKPKTAKDPAKAEAEAKLVENMNKARLDKGIDALKDTPQLQSAVQGSTVKLAEGKAGNYTLKDLAADNPQQVRDYWTRWNDGRAKGEIKSSDFGEYVKIRFRSERGQYGEATEAFGRGPSEISVKSPKPNVNEPGTDLVSYKKPGGEGGDRIKLIDNKAVRTGAEVKSVSALERNLPKNLADDIKQIEAYSKQPGVPPEIGNVVLPRLKAALNDMNAYLGPNPSKATLSSMKTQQEFAKILATHKIDRVVTTSGGGENPTISSGLGRKGFTQE